MSSANSFSFPAVPVLLFTLVPLIQTWFSNGLFKFFEGNLYNITINYHRFFDCCMEDAKKAGNDTDKTDEASHPEQKKKKVLKLVKVF